jgi:hypothetical protein
LVSLVCQFFNFQQQCPATISNTGIRLYKRTGRSKAVFLGRRPQKGKSKPAVSVPECRNWFLQNEISFKKGAQVVFLTLAAHKVSSC